jgi:hypothetical protein
MRFSRLSTLPALLGLLVAAFPISAQSVYRVVPTVTDLVATPPETLASTPTLGSSSFLAVVTTTGDTVAGAPGEMKTWRWVAGSTASTNSALLGGPLAYTTSPASGRWFKISSSDVATPTRRLLTIPALFRDLSDGTPDPTGDPTTNFQAYINLASSSFDQVLGPVTADFPDGEFSVNELIWKGKMIYNADGETHFKKKSHA